MNGKQQKSSELESVFDSGIAGLVSFCFEENILIPLYRSESVCKLSGYSQEEFDTVVNGNLLNIVVQEDRQYLVRIISEALENNTNLNTIFHIIHKSKKQVSIHASGVFLKENGKVKINTLLTETAQDAVSEIEHIYNNIPGAIFRCKFDKNWTVISANNGLFTFLGYTREEFAKMGNIMSAVIYPEDQKVMADKLKKQLVNGNVYFENENRLICKNGSIKWISIKGQLLENMQGEQYFYCVFVDITKQKEETERVKKEQKRYRVIFDMLGIAYWEWSPEGTYCSERYMEYAISEIGTSNEQGGFNYDSYVHPDDVALSRDFMNMDFLGIARKNTIMRAKMKDGTYKWTEMFSYSEKNSDGELVRMICIMREVDDVWLHQRKQLKEAVDKAEKANTAKTMFLSRVSHDMRTPLNGILGITALMKDAVVDPKIINDISQIELSGKYLLNLVKDVLDVGNIESGTIVLHPTICDGRKLLSNIIKLIKPEMNQSDIEFKIFAQDLPMMPIYIDEARLQQIAMNVLGNAVKFTPRGGCVEFHARSISMGNGIIVDEFLVKDNGIGMDEKYLSHIFEPFSQENASNTNNKNGTGLGLTITKGIVEKMNGEITVESEKGKGTVVKVVLPFSIANDEQVKEWKRTNKPRTFSYNLDGKRVLLCEDHPLNAEIAKRILMNVGIIVDHAENGKVAVDMFSKSSIDYYDAILMDIRMPVMDGLDATREIRGMKRVDAIRIPILALTANALDEDVRNTQEAGMNAHLSKPIDPENLYRNLEEYINPQKKYCRPRVLVVDDIAVNRAVIMSALMDNFEVLEAENGEDALEIINRYHGMDVVITDIQMPEMNGIELIKKIRENAEYRHVAIIANTQYEKAEQEEMLLQIGANDFVYKPSNPNVVKLRVQNAIRKI